MPKKSYDKWTVTDVKKFWDAKFSKINGRPYTVKSYREGKILKEFFEEWGIWRLLAAVSILFKMGRGNSVMELEDFYTRYSLSSQPKLEFLINEFGKAKQKQLWLQLLCIESRGFQSKRDESIYNKIIKELNVWSEVHL